MGRSKVYMLAKSKRTRKLGMELILKRDIEFDQSRQHEVIWSICIQALTG